MTEDVRPRIQKDCGTVSRTRQSFKDECDINVTMDRWANGGVLPQPNKAVPTYGDFTHVGTFLQAQVAVIKAQDDFRRLPVKVRKACENDPAKFLEMVLDEDKREELKELGLLEADLSPTLVEVINPPVAEPIVEPPQGGTGE